MIPKTIHFIYPVTERTRPWSLVNHAAVMSARKYHQDYDIIIWTNKPRPIDNFKMRISAALANAEVKQIDLPTEVAGVKIEHPQYMADVLRLQILYAYGGVYMDTDMLLRINIEGLRLTASEDNHLLLSWETPEQTSICNALMISPPENAFVGAWLDAMPEALKSPTWAQGGVVLPMELSKRDSLVDSRMILDHKRDSLVDSRMILDHKRDSLVDSRMILDHKLACPLDLSRPWLFNPELRDEARRKTSSSHAIHVFETYWRDIIKDIDHNWIERTPCLFSDIFMDVCGSRQNE
jgi:hypothetical protein